jgi:hypothetical protein
MPAQSRPSLGIGFFAAIFFALCSLWTMRALGSNDFWDDALFFQRIGFNLVHHGVAAWNVSEGPVQGNTSQLFQLLAALVVALAPDHYQLAVKLWSGAALWMALVLAARFTLRSGLSPSEPKAGALAVLLCCFCAPALHLLIASGMETLTALVVLGLFFLTLGRAHARQFSSRAIELLALVALAVLTYGVRPDLLLLTVPATCVLWEPGVPLLGQRRLLETFALTALAIGVLLALLRAYYGTAFPLSFYLKTRWLSPYDADYLALDLEGSRRQLLTWLTACAPFIAIALFRLRRWSGVLLLSSLGFVAFHHLSTVEIMGYHCRFLLPATFGVALAAASAWPTFAQRAGRWRWALVVLWPLGVVFFYLQGWIESTGVDFHLGWVDAWDWAAFVVPTCVLLSIPRAAEKWQWGLPVLLLVGGLRPLRLPDALDDQSGTRRLAASLSAMEGIYTLKECLPEPTHLYHSEIGVPGVLFLQSTVTDLSGLMNPHLVFDRPSFDSYCLADPPAALFLPHRTHQRFNREIAASACLRQYRRPANMGNSSSPLYLREDLLPSFEACRAGLK